MRLLLLSASLLTVLAMCIAADDSNFVIDQSHPFVFIQFDHVGPRKAAAEGEEPVGLWLRLINNCRVPVVVDTFDPGTGDPGTGMNYAVVLNENAPANAAHPEGYSFHVVTSSIIWPGKNLLFGMPRNHLGPKWHIQVRFQFVLAEPKSGIQPYSLASFFWVNLPKQVREQPNLN